MAELSRDEVAEVLGRVGDAIAAEIIATGIGKDELRAARDRVVRDRKSRTPGPPLQPGAFAQVVDILERSHGLWGEAGSNPFRSLAYSAALARKAANSMMKPLANQSSSVGMIVLMRSRTRRFTQRT